MPNLPTIHALWIGEALGLIERACLSSFIVVGHEVWLHCYQRFDAVPPGVQVRDANLVLPKSLIRRHVATGSYAAFSDYFRYKLLASHDGVYVDCDVFCLKPLDLSGFVLGRETDSTLNGAVLGLPPDSDVLRQLMDAFETGFIPPWLSSRRRRKLRLRKLFGYPAGYDELPWGTYGPQAITYVIQNARLMHLVQPADVFYPLDFRQHDRLYDPDLTIDDLTTHRSMCIHLYNDTMRRKGHPPIPRSSPLGRMLQRVP